MPPTPPNFLCLADLHSGECAWLIDLDGCRNCAGRLTSLGFTPGARIEVLQNYGHGPLVVNIRGSRIALGRGEAKAINVRREQHGIA